MTAMPPPAANPPSRITDRLRMFAMARRWWRRNLVENVDQMDAIRRVKEECDLGGRYVFMTSMSAGIAVLGLILSSPAVVIGAMLLSPLMGPIIGAGFALAIWDTRWMREAARTLLVGTVAAILLAALISFLSPIQDITPEIASRTRPSLLDLAVALFSGLAGSYAMIRGRSGAIVGVAIAVALMPPLGVVGFGLATWNGAVFKGALLLFITNLVTIAATSAVMARLYGFRSTLSKKRGWLQSVIILVALLALAVPLTVSLSSIAWEANAQRQMRTTIEQAFDPRAQIELDPVDFSGSPLTLGATVLTPEVRDDAEAQIEARLTDLLGRPILVELAQFQVDAGGEAAEQAALSAARTRADAEAAKRQTELLTDRLALVAMVDRSAVTIDRDARRARVVARPIDGASLAAYRAFERRIAASATGWNVELVPPLTALPAVPLDPDANPDPDAAALVAWAASRRELPVRLTGPVEAVEAFAADLREAGVSVATRSAGDGADRITAEWALPEPN